MAGIASKPEDVGLCSTRLNRLHDWMAELVEREMLPGIVVMVSRHGRTAWLSAIGNADISRSRPMQADTIFRIYSMTKPLASVAAMVLYERGYFQLDDAIDAYIPGFARSRVFTGGAGRGGRASPRAAPSRSKTCSPTPPG